MPALIVTLALCGCNTLARQPESAETSAVILHDSPPVDRTIPASEKVEPAHLSQPADQRLSINLHVFGISYHPDREGTRISHLDNELNVGLGFGYKLYEDYLGVVVSEVGFFKDSGRNWAQFAGVGYQLKLTDRWKLGADLLAIQSPTYNFGDAFVAPIPRLSYDFQIVRLNMIYIPRYKEFNRYSVYGLYLTVPLRK